MKNRTRIIALIALVCLAVSGYTYVEHWTANQNTAHEIAELARGMGLPESDPIITRAQEIWWEEQRAAETPHPSAEPTPSPQGEGFGNAEPTPEDEVPTPEEIEPEPSNTDPTQSNTSESVDLYSGVLDYSVTYDADTETEAIMLAKLIRGEARGIWSQTEQACIVWTVLNRVDAGMYSSVYAAITAPYQFAYNSGASTYDDYGRDLTALARDVLYRWKLERSGQTDVGRVLPAGYCWYSGDGRHNYFRASYYGQGSLYFGLTSPYES